MSRVCFPLLFLLLRGGALTPAAAPNGNDDAGKVVQAAAQDFSALKGEEFAVGGVMDHTAFRGTLNAYGARRCSLYTRRVIADGSLNPPNYDCEYLASNAVSQAAAWAEYDRLAGLLKADHPNWKFTEKSESDKGDADTPATASRTLTAVAPSVEIELCASNTANAFYAAVNDLKGAPGYMVTLQFNSTVKQAPPAGPQ